MKSSSERVALFIAVIIGAAGCLAVPKKLPAPGLQHQKMDYRDPTVWFELENGASFAITPEPKSNLVAIDVRYRVGSVDDPPGKEGLAHLVEHLLFETRHAPSAPTISERLGDFALYFNAWTTWDETHYTATALAAELPKLIAIERDRMQTRCEQIDEEVLARERDIVIQEIAQKRAALSDAETLIRALYGDDHPYSRSPGGTPAGLRAIERQDVCRFIERHYGPESSIVVLSGAITPGVAHPHRRTFAEIPARPDRELRTRIATRETIGRTSKDVSLDVRSPTAVIGFPMSRGGSGRYRADLVIAELVTRHLSEAKGVKRVDFSVVGGQSAPMLIFALVPKPGVAPRELARRFEDEAAAALARLPDVVVGKLAGNSLVSMMRSHEPFHHRALRAADFVQYAGQKRGLEAEFHALDSMNASYARARGATLLAGSRARIIAVTPVGERAEDLDTLSATAGKAHDVEIGRGQSDPAAADTPAPPLELAPAAPRRSFVLGNGLRVVLVSNSAHPVVDARLVLPAGYDSMPDNRAVPLLAADQLGMPSLETYEMRAHTTARKVWSRAVPRWSSVRDQWTVLGFRALDGDLPVLLWTVYALMRHGDYAPASIARMKERLDHITEDDVRDEDTRRRALLGPVASEAQDLLRSARAATVAELRAFKAAHYGPGGAVFQVVGHFDPVAVEAEIRRLLERIPVGPKRAPLRRATAKRQAGQLNLAEVDDDEPQLRVQISFPIGEGETAAEAAALALVGEVVEQRLAFLRRRLGVTYGVDVYRERLAGQRYLTVRTRLARTLAPDALRALDAELARLRSGEDVASDLVRARKQVMARLVAQRADSDSIADALQRETTRGQSAQSRRRELAAVSAMTRADFLPALAAVLRPDRAVRLIAGKRRAVEASYRALAARNIRWMAPAEPATR